MTTGSLILAVANFRYLTHTTKSASLLFGPRSTCVTSYPQPISIDSLFLCYSFLSSSHPQVGNILVCIAVYANATMRTVTNIFIVNLAIADLLVIILCLPPTVVWDVTETWFLGEAMCKGVLYFQVRYWILEKNNEKQSECIACNIYANHARCFSFFLALSTPTHTHTYSFFYSNHFTSHVARANTIYSAYGLN